MNKHVTTTTTARTFVAYVRISKDRPNETSTSSQEASIRAWAQSLGKELVDVIVEPGRTAFGASRTNRPGMQRAMDYITSGAADGFVCWKLDRTARNTRDFLDFLHELQRHGAAFASVTEQFDTSTPIGQAMITIVAALAQLESATKAVRAASWQEGRREKGQPHSGPTAFGYRRADNSLVIHDAEAAVVREAAAALLAGDTVRAVVARLNAGPMRPRLAAQWNRRGVKQMVIRPTVAGLIEMAPGEYARGAWPAILDRDDFDQLVALLTDPARANGTPTNERRWLLSGLGVCGRCGATVVKGKAHGRARYVCPSCLLSINADDVDRLVGEAIVRNLDPRTWTRLRSRRRAVDTSALEGELAQAAADHEADVLTYDEYRAAVIAIKRRIADTAGQPVALPNVDDVRRSWPDLPIDAKRLVLTAAVETVTINAAKPGANAFDPDRVTLSGWSV